MNILWKDGYIQSEIPKNPKKLTGTRFPSALGLNPFNTPFQMWCECTKVYEKPFEDNIYTIAGKTIEPKQASYIQSIYPLENLVRPEDVFGSDYFNKTRGDFFAKESKILGGMWDYLFVNEDGSTKTLIECKTTKRAEDWEEEPPIYYQLQASLYAYLLGTDDVMIVASFLEDKDYEKPDKFKCNSKNTIVYRFSLKEKFPKFYDYVNRAEEWYKKYVLTGESPYYNETKDIDILKELRSKHLNPTTEVDEILKEAEELQDEINAVEESIAEKVKRLETLKGIIKQYCQEHIEEGQTNASVSSKKYRWVVSIQTNKGLNKDALMRDGLFEKYNTKETKIYKLTCKEI